MKKTKAKTRKISIIFIVLFFIMSISVVLYATGTIITNPTELQFEDKNLYDAIKDNIASKKIKYNANDVTLTIEVSQDDINSIEELSLQGADDAKIVNVNGLQKFINLKKLNLSNNNITDISAISGLSYLTSIDLSNNVGVTICDGDRCYLPNQSNLQELNIASTSNNDISFVSKLTNLKDLNVSNNGISVLTSLRTLKNLEKLDVSYNAGIKKIDEIISISTLKDLNIASSGITDLLHSNYIEDVYEHGIFDLSNLESLNVANNQIDIEPVYRLYYIEGTGEHKAYLKKLQKLNFNYTGQSYVDYWSLSYLTNLTHLYMKGNEIYDVSSDITQLTKLEYINLSDNNIEDISGFISYDYEGNIVATLAATKIELAHNKIQDIRPIGKINHDITYLDLSENAVFYIDAIDNGKFSFKDGLNLRRQGLGYDEYIYVMEVTKKVADLDQYIILPTLFQNSKKSGSVVYADNINFTTQNAVLNSESKYNEPGYYNIIINHETSEETDISIVLNGGCADESTLHFKLTYSDDSVDSLIFPDLNLSEAVHDEINKKITEMGEENLYVKRALDILNITNTVVDNIDTLYLQDKDIEDLTGLSNFEYLSKLYLADNNISSIEELRFSTNMTELYIGNNRNIGNNNTVLEQMTQLEKLDLSNTGLTNINSLKNLINKWEQDYYFPLKYLNISNNQLADMNDIEKITSLEELYISNIGISDISKIEALSNLKTLNASVNKIKDIEVLKSLTKLRFLNVSDNQIENIVPISRISLDDLDFSKNRIKDISSLTKSYTTLNMSNNQISDISNIENASIENFAVRSQKILYVLDEEMTGNILVSLPAIFKSTKSGGSKVYTETDFICANCELSNDGNSVIINKDNLGNKFATVKISGGNANGTTFVIAEPIKGTLTYNPSNEIKTNQDITATISFNRSNVTITNNNGKNNYTFTENGEFTFEYIDEYGFEGTTTAIVNNIDKVAPQCTEIKKEIVDKKVVVTIKSNEIITQPDGWSLAEDKLSITKTYAEDANVTVNLVDEAGNTTPVNVEIKIDKTVPKITGVENGVKYNKTVTPVVEDENLNTVTLTKDGTVVANYQLGTVIKETGIYVITAIDKFGNTTTISFEIDVSDIITSEEFTVTEEEQIVKDINPNTTATQFKQKIQAEMEYEIIDRNGTAISETSKVGTGYKIKMETGKTYSIVVLGDANGDGKAELRDILAINKHRLNKANLTGEYLQAGDVNGDGNADLKDILKINKYRLGKINEL